MGSHLITVKQTQMILINTTMVVPQHKFIQNKGFKLRIYCKKCLDIKSLGVDGV